METLLKKSGSASPRRVFRKMLRDMIAADTLPDYTLSEAPGDLMRFERRGVIDMTASAPSVSATSLEGARALRPGADV